MKISGLGHNITQEKWNFSLVLMETIVDTLLKVTSSKIKLVQLRSFTEWKNSKIDRRINNWIRYKEKLGNLNNIYEYLKKKKIRRAFSKLTETTIIFKLKASFDSDLEEIKTKYKTKLLLMSQEINDLNEKQLLLEKSSANYLQKERNYKASIKVLEENSEPKELTNSDEYNLLLNENIRLKTKLQSKESKLISYFEGLSVMIDNAPIRLGK